MRALLVAAAGLLVGCGSSVPGERACDDQAAAYCARTAACSPHALAARYGDAATCRSREARACLSRLAAPATSLTGSFVEGCALALPAEACLNWSLDAPVLACVAPPGTLVDGTPCTDSSQCRSGTCNLGVGRTCGSCGAPAHAGEACDAKSCARGLACVGNVCVAPGAMDGSCDDAQPCAIGLSCVGAGAGAEGVCQPAIANVGDDCDPAAMTAAACDLDLALVCDPATKKCVAAPAPPVPLPDGAACDPASGPPCTAPAKCVAGVCTLPDPASC